MTLVNKSLIAALSFLFFLAASPMVSAAENPFGMTDIETQQVAGKDGKCGEGKCGGSDKKGKCGEGKCGGSDKKGKCGEGKCGGGDKKGKCGEGKCGEGKCGGGKSDKKGKCGEGKCGG